MSRQEGDTFLCRNFTDTISQCAQNFTACTLYLLVLVGSDRSEDSLREAEHLEDAPADTEEIVCLHDVEARLVTVHGVQDDLEHTKDKVAMCHPCQHTAGHSQDTHF